MKTICKECGATVDWSDLRQVGHHNLPGHGAAVAEKKAEPAAAQLEGSEDSATTGVVHFITCAVCGQSYDKRELAEVTHHRRPDHKPMLRD